MTSVLPACLEGVVRVPARTSSPAPSPDSEFPLPSLCSASGLAPSLSLDVLEPAPSGLSSAFPWNPAWVHVIPSGPLCVLVCGSDWRPQRCSCLVPALPRGDRSRAGERPPQRTRSHGARAARRATSLGAGHRTPRG